MVLLCPQRAPATTDPCRTPKLGAGPDSLNVIGNRCYVFDLWVQQWRKRKGEGGMIVVRYADDFVVGFQRRWEVESFLKDLTHLPHFHAKLGQFC